MTIQQPLLPVTVEAVEAMLREYATGRGPNDGTVVANRRTWEALGFAVGDGPARGESSDWRVRAPKVFEPGTLGHRYGCRMTLTTTYGVALSGTMPDGLVGVCTERPDGTLRIRRSIHGSLPA